MFRVDQHIVAGYVLIEQDNNNYLHSDGNIYSDCPECWPTRELAQAVLDKYQPTATQFGTAMHQVIEMDLAEVEAKVARQMAEDVARYARIKARKASVRAQETRVELDKCQPPHVWEHGDVFKNIAGIQIYLEPNKGPIVCNLEYTLSCGTPEIQLSGSNIKFLFNIKDKL